MQNCEVSLHTGLYRQCNFNCEDYKKVKHTFQCWLQDNNASQEKPISGIDFSFAYLIKTYKNKDLAYVCECMQKDILLVQSQCTNISDNAVTRSQCFKELILARWDIVNAIMNLTRVPECLYTPLSDVKAIPSFYYNAIALL